MSDDDVVTITEFIEARLAEDEASARRLQGAVEASSGSYVCLGLDHPELAAGDCPGYLGEAEVRHLNGRATDNRASNLAYGSRSANVRDAIVHRTNVSARKTHCPAGHAYTPDNTQIYRGWRYCLACRAEKNARLRAATVSRAEDYDEEWKP